MALLGLEGALKHYYYYYFMSVCICTTGLLVGVHATKQLTQTGWSTGVLQAASLHCHEIGCAATRLQQGNCTRVC
jgi:hypothetical protein